MAARAKSSSHRRSTVRGRVSNPPMMAVDSPHANPNEPSDRWIVQPLKTVQLLTSPGARKALFYDWQTDSLRPNLVFVDCTGSVLFESNELGLCGDAVDSTRKLGVVWGDSVVFGNGRSWPCLLDGYAPGYQFLNGGIEGDPYTNILRRATLLNRQRPVALNLLMLGWHPFEPHFPISSDRPLKVFRRNQGAISAAEQFRRDLTTFFQEIPNTVLLTTPTALNLRIIEHDLSGYFLLGDDDTKYQPCWPVPYSIELQRRTFDFIAHRNAIAAEAATSVGVAVVDLFSELDTIRSADFRENFIDIMHFRARSYPRIAEAVYRGVRHLLAEADI